MKKQPEFNFQNLLNGMLDASRIIAGNYLTNFSSYNHDLRDIYLTYSKYFTKLSVSPLELLKIQNCYLDILQHQQQIWINTLGNLSSEPAGAVIKPSEHDKRFTAPQWTNYPYFNFIKQNYLLLQQFSESFINELEMDDENKKKLHFYTKHYSDLFSPANFLFTNPEAMDFAITTRGKSLWMGFNNFLNDLRKGKITQTEEFAFQVGKNLATTPGGVIFENELIQLIQYKPVTKNVLAIPLLLIPPWINKYYILDLRPENSFVRFLVEKGITVFTISWKNPAPELSTTSFDDYVQKGTLQALSVIEEITNSKKINALGYCLGGTLLGITASVLTTRKRNVINTLTFLGTMIDFSDIGPMGAVIDHALVRKLKRGEILRDGILHGYDLERAFNLIRANDLVWKYATNNYLLGKSPKPFDVLFWTNDNTNLPGNMYIYYMEQIILGNKLRQKNALRICDTLIDIGKVEFPTFVVAFTEDYITPAVTAFKTTELMSGPVEFILGESGHVMGVVNPPPKQKYGHYINGKLGNGLAEWKQTAEYKTESWWVTWSAKLVEHSGTRIAAPKRIGNDNFKEIESAPGKYVTEKCVNCFKGK